MLAHLKRGSGTGAGDQCHMCVTQLNILIYNSIIGFYRVASSIAFVSEEYRPPSVIYVHPKRGCDNFWWLLSVAGVFTYN